MTPDVPDIELEPLRLYRLDIESLCGGDRVYVLAGRRLKDCSLASVVEPQQKYTKLSVRGGFQFSNENEIKISWAKIV